MTIPDKAMAVTGANLGIEQTLVEEAPSKGAKGVDARIHRPLAHPEGPVTLLTPDLTSAAQTQTPAHQQGSTTRTPAGHNQRGTQMSWPPPWRN
jgi:hypothetical protein